MANKDNFQSLMRRARWDRIIGALIALLIVMILFASLVKSCSREEEDDTRQVNNSVSDKADATEPATEPPEEYPMSVFLSPSTQEDNQYACDSSVTEESAMFELAEKVKALLEAEGIKVYMCGDDDNVKKKVATGNELKCGAYVALHTNAGGESGTDAGTECYYNSEVEGSRELAENVYNRVAELTPTDDRGLKDEHQRDLYEILNNQTPCCLLEVEFHDSEEHSRWILDNQNETAKCIKDGIVAFLNSQYAAKLPTETETTTDEEAAE